MDGNKYMPDIFDCDFEVDCDFLMDNDNHTELLFLSDDILLDNIKSQIENFDVSVNNGINYIDVYKIKYHTAINIKADEPERLEQLKQAYVAFYKEILKSLQEFFKFNIEVEDENLEKVVGSLYNILVLNYTDNLESFLFSYIFNNRINLVKNYQEKDLKGNRKERYNQLKKKISSTKDLNTIFFIKEIIEDIRGTALNTFFSYLHDINEDELSLLYFINNVEQNIDFTPEFYEIFFRCLNDEEKFNSSLVTSLQMKFLKLFLHD